MKEKIKNKKSLVAVVAGLSIALIGLTFAYYTSNTTFENVFNAGKYKITLTEEFESPENWVPGETIPKTVTAKNDGTVDAAVRISYTEQWTTEIDGVETDITSQVSPNPAIINFANQTDWTLSNGKYYYKYILKPTDETSSFISGVTLDPNLNSVTCTGEGNTKTCEAQNKASGAKYKLTFTIETIQYDVYESEWNTNVEITEKSQPAVVSYENEGRVAYFDPVTSNTCDSSTFNAGNVANGTSTCYKWNVLEQQGTDTTLMLDHEIGNSAWTNGSIENGPVTVLNSLKTATNTWTRVPTLNYSYDTSSADNGGYGVLTCTNGSCSVGSNAPMVTDLRARLLTLEEIEKHVCNTAVINFETSRYFCNDNALSGIRKIRDDDEVWYSRNLYLNEWGEDAFNNSVQWILAANNTLYNISTYYSLTLSPLDTYEIWVFDEYAATAEDTSPSSSYYTMRPIITVPTNLVTITQ